MKWLQGLFQRETQDKAKRSWRLLILDGHGSHLTLKFLDWCDSHRILVAVYPPHSTHRLQPLDVSLFSPLATYYSQGLDALTRLSEGQSSVTKRDFFKIFYPAFDRAFTVKNVNSGWSKTGLVPFNPDCVLSIFKKEEPEDLEPSRSPTPCSGHSSSCLDSPSATRKIRQIVNETVANRDTESQRTIGKLGDAILSLSARLTLSELREKEHLEALSLEKKKRKRGKRLMEEFRAEEGTSIMFFSPSKVRAARELQIRREQAKEQQKEDKELRTLEKAALKVQKEQEAQKKRDERAAAAAARRTAEALKKAARAKELEAKKAQKQLEMESNTSNRRPRKRPKIQSVPPEAVVVVDERVVEEVPEQPKTRRGRIIRTPAHLLA